MIVSRCSALLLPLLFAAFGVASAQDFSGDIVDLQKPGAPTLVKLCVSGKKTRIEFQPAGNDRAFISPLPVTPGQKERLVVQINGAGRTVILDAADKTTVILDVEDKIYDSNEHSVYPNPLYTAYAIHIPDPEDYCAAMMKGKAEGMTCTKSGYESVDGRRAVRYETSIGGEAASLWFDLSLRILVKRKNDWTSTELHNVRGGTQPPNLFEIPKNYVPGALILGGVVGKAERE